MNIDGDEKFEPLPDMEIRLSPKAGSEPSLWRLFRDRETRQMQWLQIPAVSVRPMSASLVYQDRD